MFRKFRRFLNLIILLLVLAAGGIFLFSADFTSSAPVVWGLTFSDKYAKDLGLDWQKTFTALLDELNADNFRLIAYWDEIESVEDNFDYSALDWQVEQASSRNKTMIIAVGRRTPRWPECHDPAWLNKLSDLAVEQQQLEFVKATIERYKDNPLIKFWQVENEPLFSWFGHCPRPSKQFLIKEVNLVRSLDDSREIIITDSGELNHWQGAASLTDRLGITMYRIVWNKYLGFWDYWFFPPSAYRLKADATIYFHKNLKDVIVTELQMEPWSLDRRMVELTLEEQRQSFDIDRFRENVEFVKRAGFSEAYVWGPEYWYWLKLQGHDELWEEGKKLWQ